MGIFKKKKHLEVGEIDRLKEQIRRIEETKEREARKTENGKRNTRIRGRIEPECLKPSEEDVKEVLKLTGADKKLLKKELIKQRIEEYLKPIKVKGVNITPSISDAKEYEEILKKCDIKSLKMMGKMYDHPLQLDLGDRIKSRNKKEFAVVTIFNDNQTTDTGVIHCYDRTFSRNEMTYLIMNERGVYDPEFKMTHFYYYANQVCPIVFQKGKLPENAYDARLIDDTIQMKVIEALAAVDIEKFVKVTLVCIILNLLLTGVSVLILANMNGLIPKGGA